MNLKMILSFLAIAGALIIAAPKERAHALSLINPSATGSIQGESSKLTTEVHWRRHGWNRHYDHRHYDHRRYDRRRYDDRRYWRR